MKVVLLQDIKALGKKGQLVDVADGYAQNFLLPKKMAKFADNSVLNESKQKESSSAFHQKVELEKAKELGEKLKKLNLEMEIKIGATGKAFGSITSKEISETLLTQNFDIDKKKIYLKEPIKSEGNYKVIVKLHPEVEVWFNLKVLGKN